MEKVAMELTEEQFRYLRLLDGLQEDEKYTAADLAERTGDKERNVRRYLGSLVEEGYLLVCRHLGDNRRGGGQSG